MDKETQQSSRI